MENNPQIANELENNINNNNNINRNNIQSEMVLQNFNTETNQNNNELLTARIIHELNGTNNQETLALIRQVVEIRENSLHNSLRYQILDMEDSIFDLIISNEVFLHSGIILIIVSCLIYFELNNIFKIKNLSVKHLESEELWYLYSLGFFMLIIVIWNIYLLFFKIFSFFDSFTNFRKEKMNECTSGDVLIFNPFYINLMIIHYNKAYIGTVFDFYVIMTISIAFSINFFFSNYYYNYLKKQISCISNINLTRNKLIYFRIKIFYMFLIGMNLVMSYLISFVTEYADFYFVYILQIKSIYLILKQIGMWYENEISYKQLDTYYATNEDYYLQSHMNKMIIGIIGSVSQIYIKYFTNTF